MSLQVAPTSLGQAVVMVTDIREYSRNRGGDPDRLPELIEALSKLVEVGIDHPNLRDRAKELLDMVFPPEGAKP